MKWDYNQSKSAFDSLAGFSHGASGIAYCLMQVGNYFKNDGLIYLAEQTLAYEMQYFHTESGNWLDLRLGKYRLSLPNIHQWDLNIFLPEMKKVNSWAHGAGGVGLARLYAWQLTGKELYFQQCQLVMERCLKDLEKLDRTDFTLCSGYTGLLLPFLSEFSSLIEKDYSRLFASVTDQAKSQYEKKRSYNTYISANQFDYGLLSGKAGVGYTLLYLLNQEMDNAVYPVLPQSEKLPPAVASHSKFAIQRRIFLAHYTKTIDCLNSFEPDFMQELQAEDINEFEQKICQKIRGSKELEDSGIAEVFDFENKMAIRWKLHKIFMLSKEERFYFRQGKTIVFSYRRRIMQFII
ncbi:lanthionine synthetase LanC family protein [Pedobacter sp. NJ-S-72]